MTLKYLIIFIFSVVPSRPVGPLVVTDVQRNAISIKWKPSAEDGGAPITGYLIEKRHESARFWSKANRVSADTTKLCVRDLQENTAYYFRVIAENQVGESEPLESIEATIAKSPFSKHFFLKFCYEF